MCKYVYKYQSLYFYVFAKVDDFLQSTFKVFERFIAPLTAQQ